MIHNASRDGERLGQRRHKFDQHIEYAQQRHAKGGPGIQFRSPTSGEDGGGGGANIFRHDRHSGAGWELPGGHCRGCEPWHEINDEHPDHQSGGGRPALRHLLYSIHRNRLRAALLALWQRLVQDRPVPYHRYCLCQHLHLGPHEPRQVFGSSSPHLLDVMENRKSRDPRHLHRLGDDIRGIHACPRRPWGVSGHGRLVVGEHDGLPNPTTVRLALLPNDVFLDELPTATDADMLLLHLHARQALARPPRQRRESTRKTTRYEAGARRRRRFRLLLVPYTGDTGDEVIERLSTDTSDDNGPNSQSYPGIHEQLCQSYTLRLSQ